MSVKIAQIGVFNRNIGDTIALQAIRNRIGKYYDGEIEWVSVDLLDKFAKVQNDIGKSKARLNEATKDADLLIVGGCGLIEGGSYNRLKTGWKLPFNKETLPSVKCPMVAFAIGLNLFRGQEGLTSKGIESVNHFINACDLFSVRNDGSYEGMRKLGFRQEKLEEVPDGGIIYDPERIKADLEKVEDVAFNPTYNRKQAINRKRGLTPDVTSGLIKYFNGINASVLPHIHKAYGGWKGAKWMANQKELTVGLKLNKVDRYIDKHYNKIDLLVPMHGHGQLIAFGKNVPFISLSTQDKLRNLCKKYNLEEYCVDTSKKDWKVELIKKIDKIRTNKDYLQKFYEIRHSHYDKIIDTFDNYTKRVIELLP
jgi:polysaccharide pyruvyl transferase WcaK-like protein